MEKTKKPFNEIKRLSEFEKDFKALSKKYRTLDQDFNKFVGSQLEVFHSLGIDNGSIKRIPGLNTDYPLIYKARKFACQSLKGRGSQTGIRVIYAYFADKNEIELIEIYYKGDKPREDRARIIKHYVEEKFERSMRNRMDYLELDKG